MTHGKPADMVAKMWPTQAWYMAQN